MSILVVNTVARLLFESFTLYIMTPFFVVFMALYLFLVLNSLDRQDLEIVKAIEYKSGLRLEFLRKIVKRFI